MGLMNFQEGRSEDLNVRDTRFRSSRASPNKGMIYFL